MCQPYQAIEHAIEAAESAKREIILIEADRDNQALLDDAYDALTKAIESLSKLLEPVA